jgi:hypothetical protein
MGTFSFPAVVDDDVPSRDDVVTVDDDAAAVPLLLLLLPEPESCLPLVGFFPKVAGW